MKTCSRCRAEKSLTEFYVKNTGRQRGQHHAYCKACTAEVNAARRARHPLYAKAWFDSRGGMAAYERQRRYGITPDEYARMVEAQEGRCPICQNKRRLVIDHCHAKGHIRGLLCRWCNYLLGVVENPEWMARAQEYLRATADPGGLLLGGGLREPSSG